MPLLPLTRLNCIPVEFGVSFAIAFRAVAIGAQVSGLSVRARGTIEEASLFDPWKGVGDDGD